MVATPSDFRVDPERTALTLPLTQNDSTTEGEPSEPEQAQQRSDKAGIDSQTFFVLNRVIDQVKVQVPDSVFAGESAIGYFFCIDFAK